MAEEQDHNGSNDLSRRDLLGWLGKGAVLALGADLAALCTSAAAEPKSFPFQPGAGRGRVFDEWPVRTVDPQNLVPILARWHLEIGGLVEEPRTYTFAEILALPRTDQVKDFHCVEGWSVDDVPWNGVVLSELLRRSRPTKKATHVNIHTVGGRYNDSLPLPVAMEPATILAYGVAGSTIPLNHGFPLRVVVPRLLGYKNAKYVERLELADKPLIGYWVAAGYDLAGLVPESRLRSGHY
ncbi:MAG: molybdopterin-dependent oxidoreductase [Deltaproteobacteria bacterium]|nr:molybdopterin-dependent oxidoreductase [Deltaproteobacteria bacterium]